MSHVTIRANNPDNTDLCRLFMDLADYETKYGDRKQAVMYRRAIAAIQTCPAPVTSGSQLEALPGGLDPSVGAIIDTYFDSEGREIPEEVVTWRQEQELKRDSRQRGGGGGGSGSNTNRWKKKKKESDDDFIHPINDDAADFYFDGEGGNGQEMTFAGGRAATASGGGVDWEGMDEVNGGGGGGQSVDAMGDDAERRREKREALQRTMEGLAKLEDIYNNETTDTRRKIAWVDAQDYYDDDEGQFLRTMPPEVLQKLEPALTRPPAPWTMLKPKLVVFDPDGQVWSPRVHQLKWNEEDGGGGGPPYSYQNDGSVLDSAGARVRVLPGAKAVLEVAMTLEPMEIGISCHAKYPRWARDLMGMLSMVDRRLFAHDTSAGAADNTGAAGADHPNARQTGLDLEAQAAILLAQKEGGDTKIPVTTLRKFFTRRDLQFFNHEPRANHIRAMQNITGFAFRDIMVFGQDAEQLAELSHTLGIFPVHIHPDGLDAGQFRLAMEAWRRAVYPHRRPTQEQRETMYKEGEWDSVDVLKEFGDDVPINVDPVTGQIKGGGGGVYRNPGGVDDPALEEGVDAMPQADDRSGALVDAPPTFLVGLTLDSDRVDTPTAPPEKKTRTPRVRKASTSKTTATTTTSRRSTRSTSKSDAEADATTSDVKKAERKQKKQPSSLFPGLVSASTAVKSAESAPMTRFMSRRDGVRVASRQHPLPTAPPPYYFLMVGGLSFLLATLASAAYVRMKSKPTRRRPQFPEMNSDG